MVGRGFQGAVWQGGIRQVRVWSGMGFMVRCNLARRVRVGYGFYGMAMRGEVRLGDAWLGL